MAPAIPNMNPSRIIISQRTHSFFIAIGNAIYRTILSYLPAKCNTDDAA
jgi:hypothetical protein